MSKPPIFIGGMFKSGTSLLRAMLGQHRSIASGLETYWFEVDLSAGTGRGGEPLADYLARLAAYFEAPPAGVERMARETADAEAFLDAFMSAVARAAGKPRWADKTPGNVTQAKRIRARWPSAPVLHIVRDPRDVYASLLEAGKWTSAEEFGSRWCAMFAAADDGVRSGAFGEANYLELRYESLVLAPEPTMRAVVAFVGEEWDPAAARFSGRDDEYQIVLEQTGKASSTLARMRTPLSDDRVGLWRKVPPMLLSALRAYVQTSGLGARYDAIVAESVVAAGAAEAAR
jgi:hypothetical protein